MNSSFSQNSQGRLTTTQYYVQKASTALYGTGCGQYGSYDDSYTEMYSYHAAGAVTAKNVKLTRAAPGQSGSASLEVDYTQDTAGRTYWSCGGSAMGFDDADQRFYASTYGRFLTPDPSKRSGGTKSPASWNKFSYTRGDPVNRFDPRGILDASPNLLPLPCFDCGGGGGGCGIGGDDDDDDDDDDDCPAPEPQPAPPTVQAPECRHSTGFRPLFPALP